MHKESFLLLTWRRKWA